jgi:hypothetical protein
MADANRCVSCGEIIPEGKLVCPICEAGSLSIKVERRESRWKRLRRKFLSFWRSWRKEV